MNAVQRKIYDIFIEIRKICEKYHLRYWAIGGTCLGAVRHQGFIPWDIDLDIAMPDLDYQKFIEIARKEFENTKYEVYGREKCHMITRVCDTDTTGIMASDINYPERYIGIHVDIMPFCGMPDDISKGRKHAYRMGWFQYLDGKRIRKLTDSETLKGKIAWCLLKPIMVFTKKDFFYDKWKKGIAKYKYDNSKYTCFLWANQKVAPKLIFKTSWFNEWIDLPFENTTIRCPKDFDDYLRIQYGEYMTFPPQSEQNVPYKDYFIDLNKSYKYYQKNGIRKT